MKFSLLLPLLLLTACDTPPKTTLEKELSVYKEEKKFADQLAKKKKMEVLAVTILSRKDGSAYGLAFKDCQKTTLEKGRAFAVEEIHAFLRLLQSRQEVKDLLPRYHKIENWPYWPDDLKIEQIGFSISYVDKKNQYYTSPSLAKILLTDGKISYYQKGEAHEELTLILQETFEEALVRAAELS